MSEYIEISDGLLRAIGEHLAAMSGPPGSKGTGDVPREFLEVLIAYLGEDLGCDHSVGICACGTADLVGELKLALDGRTTCSGCGGDGMLWSKERHDAEIARLGPEAYDYDTDSYGYYTCPTCEGRGITRLSAERVSALIKAGP